MNANDLEKSDPSKTFKGLFFAFLEVSAIGLWQVADHISGYLCVIVHFLSLACIFAGPKPIAYSIFKRESRPWFWVGCTLCWIVLAVVSIVVWRPQIAAKSSDSNPPIKSDATPHANTTSQQDQTDEGQNGFLIQHGPVIMTIGAAGAGQGFWMVYSNKSGDLVKWQVPISIYIKLTNLKPFPCHISQYSIDWQIAGFWQPVRTVDPRNRQMFWVGSDPTRGLGIDCAITSFNSAIEDKDVAPNESVEGWIYCDGEILHGGKCRFRMRDRSGARFSQIFDLISPPQNEYFDVNIDKSNSGVMGKTVPTKVIMNISNIPVAHEGDGN